MLSINGSDGYGDVTRIISPLQSSAFDTEMFKLYVKMGLSINNSSRKNGGQHFTQRFQENVAKSWGKIGS